MEIKEPLTRIEVLLETWADWMRHGNFVARGYPSKASGITELGVTSFQDMEETADSSLARAIDAIIVGLAETHQSAINHAYLGSKYLFPICYYLIHLDEAKVIIGDGLEKRGIC